MEEESLEMKKNKETERLEPSELLRADYEDKLKQLYDNYRDSVDSLFFICSANVKENNDLHAAIAVNATERALTLIENSKGINEISMGNTPLLLAIKKGNRTVAKRLLDHENLLVDITDDHGYSALRYAAMLRMDGVIKLLIKKGATLDDRYVGGFYNFALASAKRTHPTVKNLYRTDIKPPPLKRHLTRFAYFDKNEKALGNIDQQRFFSDSKNIEIEYLHPYTFLVFHIADIIHNMGWMTPEISEKIDKARIVTSSTSKFARAFSATYERFCEMHNKSPVSEDILKLINAQKTIDVHAPDYKEIRILKL